MKKILSVGVFVAALLFAFTPAAAFAQGQQQGSSGNPVGESQPTELEMRIQWVLNFVDGYVVRIIFGLAFVVFLWFTFLYFILGGADEEQRAKGRQFLMWSLIGFVLMLSLWGIVNLLQTTLGFGNQNKPCLPVFDADNDGC